MTQDVARRTGKPRNKTEVRRYAQDETLAPVQLHIDDQKLLRELNRVAMASGENLYSRTARRALVAGARLLLAESRRPRPSIDHPV